MFCDSHICSACFHKTGRGHELFEKKQACCRDSQRHVYMLGMSMLLGVEMCTTYSYVEQSLSAFQRTVCCVPMQVLQLCGATHYQKVSQL